MREEVGLRDSAQEALTDGQSAASVLPGPLSWWVGRKAHHPRGMEPPWAPQVAFE